MHMYCITINNSHFEKIKRIGYLPVGLGDNIKNKNFYNDKLGDNISKKNQRRLKIIDIFYNKKITRTSFSEKSLNKLFYFHGKEAVIDILSYRLFSLKKVDKNLLSLINLFRNKVLPTMPVGAKILMEKYDIPEGKDLGNKLKKIEENWVNNNFQL